ncbi:MAG: tripartite tricarboxylate transporter substrate binding protein [Pseudomonadota bacterium]
MTFKTRLAALAVLLTVPFASAAAQDWSPSGPLTVEIGFGAGGSTDTMGRVLARVMEEQTGWDVIAENRTGGGGVAMFTGISQRPATGETIGLGVNMPILVNLTLRPGELPFDLGSFDYLGTLARAQLALIARADAPFDTLPEMVEWSKANGGVAVGIGARPQQLLMEVVNRQDEAGFRFVSTDGEAETHQLMLGGQIMAGFSAGTHLQFLESGDFKMIASANQARHSYAPDTATFQEAGYDAYVDPFYFLAARDGIPEDARAALIAAINAAVNSEAVGEVIRNAATTEPLNLGPDGTREMMESGLVNVQALFGQ